MTRGPAYAKMMRPVYRAILKGSPWRRKAEILRVVKVVIAIKPDLSLATVLAMDDHDKALAAVAVLAAVAIARAVIDADKN